MKVLSIIIPSYNTEKFIDKNIPTFLEKTILEDLEILVVDDGSKDATALVAKRWEEKYRNTIRVISKENGGHGSVINTGIEQAKGKYFKVVDGDDWVDTQGLITLMKYLKNAETDLIINPYYLVNESHNYQKRKVEFPNIIYDKEYALEEIIKGLQYIPLHAWTIKSNILKENSIAVTEKCYYEDFQYVMYPIPYIKTVIFLRAAVYEYLVGQQGQSVSDKSVFRNREMHFQIIKDSILYYESKKEYMSRNKREYFYFNILNLIKSHYNIYLRNYKNESSYDEMRKFDRELRTVSHEFYRGVGKNFVYVKLLRTKNKILFYAEGMLLRIIKHYRVN